MKKIFLGAFSILISSVFFLFEAQPDGLLHVYFLNIGQGDSIFIRTPKGYNIIIDGGPDNIVLRELSETLPFFDTTIDYLISTHPDRDHIEGLISILKKYPVRRVLFTGSTNNSYFSRAFLKTIRQKNIPLTFAYKDSDITLEDGVALDILFPFTLMIGLTENTNNNSIVAKLIYGNNEILFTGDAEASTEEKLLKADIDIDVDVLKVGHHGSKSSSTEEFIKKASPHYSVISAGKGNPYYHPHPSVIKRLRKVNTQILRTDLDGRIEFVFSKTQLLKINKAQRSGSA